MAHFVDDMNTDVELTPAFDRMDKEYKLYVNNLPEELNKDAIKEIFGQYGQITGMFYRCNARWAYITYGTFHEAELAIRELNDKKPLYLKVALAKDRSNLEEESQQLHIPDTLQGRLTGGRALIERPITEPVTEPVFARDIKHQQSIGRGHVLHKGFATPHMTIPRKYAENRPLQSLSPSSQVSSAFENEGPFVNTNRLWTRGVITVTADGKRHVSLGRGYTLYEFPDQNPRIEEYITKVHELRNNGLYECAEDKLKNRVQKCLVCYTKTTKHCEKCYTYYCSRTCQITDWPRHQVECERIPALVEEITDDTSSMQISKDENTSKPSVTNKISSNDMKLRRPNASIQIEDLNDIKDQDRDQFIKCDNDINVLQAKKPDQSSVNTTNSRSFSQQNRLLRYTNESTDHSKRNDGHSSSSSHQDDYIRSQNGAISKNTTGYNREMVCINGNVRGRSNYSTDINQYQKNEFQNDKRSTYRDREIANKQGSKASIDSVMSDEDLTSFHKDTYLSKTKFIDVEIDVPLNNNEYWIHKIEDTNTRIDVMTKLQTVAARSQHVRPVVGDIYGVLYETLWHRAMVISLTPIKVHFIDFGNEEVLEKNADIRDIKDLSTIPKFARKIRLTQAASEKYKNLRYGDTISVKMLSMDAEKTIIVEVQKQLESSASCSTFTPKTQLKCHVTEDASQPNNKNNITEKSALREKLKVSSNIDAKTPEIRLPSILDTLANVLVTKAVPELEITGVIQIFGSSQKNVYNATLCPQILTNVMEKIFHDLPTECARIKESVDHRPNIGDLVCGEGEIEGEWYRGYVSTLSPDLRIAVVDEARILPMRKVLSYPKKFLDICTFGVICETDIDLEVGDIYNFVTIMNEQRRKQESLKIEMTKDNKVLTAVIKPWEYITKSSVPAFANLKSGSKICLTSYRNQHTMFARSLDETEVEFCNNITQRVALSARTAPRLSELPNTGQMVIAPFCDGNNYRAMVTKVQDEKVTVVYVDFGNFEDTNVNELRVLPDDLAMERSCTARIILKDIPRDVPMTTEIDAYLRDLVGMEVPLTCVYEDGLLKNGVHLTTSTEESVNNTIKQLLIPDWKRENCDDKTCYMLNDMEIASLGRIGDTVNALILIQKDEKRYMMGPYDIDLMTHVTDVMPALIKEYCEKTEYYIPRIKELCLALYEDAWYRALCLNPRQSSTTCEIFFVDYGNVEFVEHKNIRSMPKDFITPAAVANMCTVINLAPVNVAGNYSPAVEQKILELVVPNAFTKIKIVDCVEAGDYKIELPDVRAALIKQGLITPS